MATAEINDLTLKAAPVGTDEIEIQETAGGDSKKALLSFLLDRANHTGEEATADLADGAVTTVKLGADAVDGTKIADNAVDSEHIVAGAIDTAHLGALQVTGAKIAADAIDGTKIADDSIDSEHYAALSIDTEHIAASQVTTAKLAPDAVDGTKLADNAVDSEHIVAGAIDPAHFASGALRVMFTMEVTLGTLETEYLAMPFACTVTKISSVIMDAITAADETLTFNNHAGTGMTGGVITITQVGSAAGDVDSVSPSADNTFVAGEKLECVVGGENGTAVKCRITIHATLT